MKQRAVKNIATVVVYLLGAWLIESSSPALAQPKIDGDHPDFVDLGVQGSGVSDSLEPVLFDLDGDGSLELVQLTLEDPDDGWLVLDRNNNGLIDDGSELFGRFAGRPEVPYANGYEALAVFDQPELGGNRDGILSVADEAFRRLGVWFDRDRNGHSTVDELASMADAGIVWVGLDYETYSCGPISGVECTVQFEGNVRLESHRFVRSRAHYVGCP